MNVFMQAAFDAAVENINNGTGGPFGACVVRDGEIIAATGNRVLGEKDPTAHAEISAIRDACRKLGTYKLDGCEIYATGEPCPMCLAAIAWAGIKTCYFANSVDKAEAAGFADSDIYRHIRGEKSIMRVVPLDGCGECGALYAMYEEKKGKKY